MDELVIKDGIGYCPICGSKKITEYQQVVLYKRVDYNSGKIINPYDNTTKMSNKDKAKEYDKAGCEGAGCINYICRKCGWTSEIYDC